jgi:hypothetical protein
MGGAAGSEVGGDACTQENATRHCCWEGTRTCANGVWGACVGAFVSGESCNGVDDDCDGEVDEGLGTFRCGLGACATEVAACSNGALATCVAPQPMTAVDDCNEIDDDCDGAVDEDCATCVHVSPTGDDAAANANDGATPFASVQAAIDFAASFRSAAKRVCVAAGAACGATFVHSGPPNAPLTMRNGIDVLGNYESTTWTRCSNSTTRLQPQALPGVYFPSSVVTRTVLDGFVLHTVDLPGVAKIHVDGARGVLLSNLSVSGGTRPAADNGLASIEAVDAVLQISRSRITGTSTSVRAVRSQISVMENCSGPLDSSGRCTSSCPASGPSITSAGSPAGSGIELESSPHSRIEANAFCGTLLPGSGSIRLIGNADETVIRANAIQSILMNPGSADLVSVRLGPCAGSAPRFTDNTINTSLGGTAILSLGDCHPIIQANREIAAGRPEAAQGSDMRAIHCAASAGVPSRCVISENPRIHTKEGLATQVTSINHVDVGVRCEDGSCARIDHNGITGLDTTASTPSDRFVRLPTGVLILGGDRLLVDSNVIFSGASLGIPRFLGTGISTSTSVRIQNNRVSGCCGTQSTGLLGAAEIFSNSISVGQEGAGLRPGDGAVVRNNQIQGGQLPPLVMNGAGTIVFQNNALGGGPGPLAALPGGSPTTIAELEALLGTGASGNINHSCLPFLGSPCIDGGTPLGAPHFDFEGDARGALPDIGRDEYVP